MAETPRAVKPVIGHAKSDGLLGRNWLRGRTGDRSNALLAPSGLNSGNSSASSNAWSLFCTLSYEHFSLLSPSAPSTVAEAAHPLLNAQNYSALRP